MPNLMTTNEPLDVHRFPGQPAVARVPIHAPAAQMLLHAAHPSSPRGRLMRQPRILVC